MKWVREGPFHTLYRAPAGALYKGGSGVSPDKIKKLEIKIRGFGACPNKPSVIVGREAHNT